MVVDALVLNMWLYVVHPRKPRYAGGRPPQLVKPFCLDGDMDERRDHEPMPVTTRAAYAFATATLIVGVVMVGDMLFRFEVGQFMFSPYFVVPLLVVAYLAAPYISKLLRLGP